MATTRLHISTNSLAPCRINSLCRSDTHLWALRLPALLRRTSLRRAPDRALWRMRQGARNCAEGPRGPPGRKQIAAMARTALTAALAACVLACAATGAQQPGCRAAMDTLQHCSAGAAGDALQPHCCLPFRFLQEFGCFWCAARGTGTPLHCAIGPRPECGQLAPRLDAPKLFA